MEPYRISEINLPTGRTSPRNAVRMGVYVAQRLLRTLLSCILTVLMGSAMVSIAAESDSTPDAKSDLRKQIQVWIGQLNSDSYAERHLAYQLLQSHPVLVLEVIEPAILAANEDAAHRLIRLLGIWSELPDEGYGRTAFAILEGLAKNRVTTRSALAGKVVEGIHLQQERKAEKILKLLSAFIDFGEIQLFATAATEHYMLRLDDAFRGSVDELDCLRWIKSVDLVRLEGKRIDGAWLEKITLLPNLRTLQIRNASLQSKDIDFLHRIEKLERLEILYTPIDDKAIESLGSLSVAGKVRLFGTQMSEEGVKRLSVLLEGSDITYGRGGFLGVSSNGTSLVLGLVIEGGAADEAGIRLNDRIIQIQDVFPRTFDELRAELAKYAPGDEVKVVYERVVDTQKHSPSERPAVERTEVKVILGEQK